MGRLLFLREIIHDEHLIQLGFQDIDKGPVSRVGQVPLQVGLLLEGDKEAMRVAVVQAFGAHV